MSKVYEVYSEGETVLIKAKVAKVHIDKDKVTYELSVPIQKRFTERDVLPYTGAEDEEETEEKESEEDGIQL